MSKQMQIDIDNLRKAQLEHAEALHKLVQQVEDLSRNLTRPLPTKRKGK